MATNGQRGADFERRVRKHLEARGYIVVRSAASKTGVDLLALRAPLRTWDPEPPMLIQAKLDGRLDPDEWNWLYGMATCSMSRPVLVELDRSRKPYEIVFWTLTGPKVPRSRTFPRQRITWLSEPVEDLCPA